MRKTVVMAVGLLSSAIVSATPLASLVGEADIGNSEGVVRVEFVAQQESFPVTHGRLRVSRVPDASFVQQMDVSFIAPPEGSLAFEFADLNDDGYKDLMFHNSATGHAGVSASADVFLWVPNLGRFVQSKTLSQAGEIAKSKSKGCVSVTVKCSATSWQTREFCWNQRSGRWRIQRDTHCQEPAP